MTVSTIAIVGMACQYPDASSPLELWENALAQRRAFREMPAERLSMADYFAADRQAADRLYSKQAAVLKDYEFDRVRFRVGGTTFRSTDMTHWLALDVAAQALTDAGFPEGEGLKRESTGVLLGNTLTGEFSRANIMRLRWPYVRRVVDAALVEQGWSIEQRQNFLGTLETQYKTPFPTINEESLAGGLSNTIAGRICNYFDLKGGGYTVDGACASSLLAIANACSALIARDLDVALAGGVDLSLDPFELIGFAKTSALAPEKMRVYDARSAGFWPGEGCGFVVLMRHEDALAQQRRIYALIQGWGISSDGHGGITRPEVEGQMLAIERAYRRAGFGIDTVSYFEGHGTGTAVGDATELRTLSYARQKANPDAPAAAIGSIKANIGHTKAAAGVGGLIKATMALHTQIVPPHTGNETPHPELTGESPALKTLSGGECWPPAKVPRAGVSAMGFGGINSHIVLEGTDAKRCNKTPDMRDQMLLSSVQDAELFLLGAANISSLQEQVEQLLAFAAKLSVAELTDLAAELQQRLTQSQVRAAIVASTPSELVDRLETLQTWLADGVTDRLDIRSALFLGSGVTPPRIGYLFPGQGTRTYLDGGALGRRFAFVSELYRQTNLPQNGHDGLATAVAQPAIVTASLAALRTLNRLEINAQVAVGHSLGEITALHWAGALDEEALLRIATARGKAMTELGHPTGAMASLNAGHEVVEKLLNEQAATIACLNTPNQTVISGEATVIAAIVARVNKTQKLKAVNIPVSHAFHSPLVAAATKPLATHLAAEEVRPLQRSVISTVTGAALSPQEDLRNLLCHQVTAPVRFTEAVTQAVNELDLLIEVGPGRVLSGLATEFVDTPIIALDAGGNSLKGLLQSAGAAFVLGVPLNHNMLFADRFARPFDLNWQAHFLVNPCELAPIPEGEIPFDVSALSRPTETTMKDLLIEQPKTSDHNNHDNNSGTAPQDTLALIRQLVADRLELPLTAISTEARLLSDLHLNSISVGQIVAGAARQLDLPAPVSPTEFADVTIVDVAETLQEIARNGGSVINEGDKLPPGLDSWVRTFAVEWVQQPLAQQQTLSGEGEWQIIAPPGYPLTEALTQTFAEAGGHGVVVCLPPQPDEQHLSLLLEAVQIIFTTEGSPQFVLVQHGGGGAAFSRTLYLEEPQISTCVIDVPFNQPEAAEWIVAEASGAKKGYTETRYDESGQRWQPTLRFLPLESDESSEPALGPDDVLLVTGGGKGITAECALSLAQKMGVQLALLGRSQPERDTELAINLERMAAARIPYRYFSVDITDPEAVKETVQEIESSLGKVTAILHGAARNVPQRLRSLDEESLRRTLAPKVQGMRNLLAAINPEQLRLMISYGSIIAQIGLPGEADYGLANEWLSHLTERFQQEHPACRCLTIDWSVWAGAGMGERLGTLDSLVQQGIMPIPLEEGVAMLHRLLAQKTDALPASVVVSGRFGSPATLQVEQTQLPFWRFLENVRAYYPGIELVVEATLSGDADPYLNDHIFQGERLFLAVMGLEAMAQVAMTLVGSNKSPIFKAVEFKHPIVVPEGKAVTIRVAALVAQGGEVEVVIRSQETAFQVNHFQAICHFENTPKHKSIDLDLEQFPALKLKPKQSLYEGLFFHRGRLRRIADYQQLKASHAVAKLTPADQNPWFSRYLPPDLVLGDPGARDATIHGIQVCVPQSTLLPVSVERILAGLNQSSGPRYVHIQERTYEAQDNTLIFDVAVTDSAGFVQEEWQGLKLTQVNGANFSGPWSAPILGPYLERRLAKLIPGSNISVAIEQNPDLKRRVRSNLAMQRALGQALTIQRRPDGKPEVVDGRVVSAAHMADITLAVAGDQEYGALGCDIEVVVARQATVWKDLLGSNRFKLVDIIADAAQEDEDRAATRVWAAGECLKKAGATLDTPLVFASAHDDGWVLLSTGSYVTATYLAQVQTQTNPLVLAVAMRYQ